VTAAPLRRAGYRLAYVALRAYSLVFRPRTRGVKCLLTAGDEILLVRHSYGPRQWDLPGGFCKRSETFAAAARREIAEELGAGTGAGFVELGQLQRAVMGSRETLRLFRVELPTRELGPRSIEIARTGWFPRDALPQRRSPVIDDVLALETRLSAPDGG
jgi:ADP-ribose pyrophosphatase YjhB (NUDIX family)